MPTAAKSQTWRNLIVVPRRDLCIDFANTVAWRGSAPAESLNSLHDLLAWLDSTNVMPARAVAGLRKWFNAHSADGPTVFAEAIEIRETLYRLLHSVATESAPPGDDLQRINNALAETASRIKLDRADVNLGWRIEARPTAAGLLAPVLWSAADILVGPDRVRVRQCANARCLWLFFDDSKNGTRRWCSMQSCGNRAKAHRHYLRHKGK
jgi:predicted RNA-binding Zn ribbon-like protein